MEFLDTLANISGIYIAIAFSIWFLYVVFKMAKGE